MKRKFVVGIDGETSQDVSSFLEYAKQQGFGWWHWFDNFWLLTTHNDAITAAVILDKLIEISKNRDMIVIEVSSITWATYGPQGTGSGENPKDISKWIRNSWSTK